MIETLVWIVELLELEQQQVFPFFDNSQYVLMSFLLLFENASFM